MRSVRNPAVAGQFYPDLKEDLLKEVRSCLGTRDTRIDAIGIVSPHAGYMYSGPVAGSVFASIEPKNIFIVLGPNHTGLGLEFALSTHDSWKTPLGEVPANKELAKKILENAGGIIEEDNAAHSHEHSIEVQLPFIQATQKKFSIVALVAAHADIKTYSRIGKAIAKSIRDLGLEKDTVIVASSDMTHYEPAEDAKKKDAAAIEAIVALDENALIRTVADLGISMCGYAPVAIMLAAVKELGAGRARLIRYQTSGDASGDYMSVVGYAGIVIARKASDVVH